MHLVLSRKSVVAVFASIFASLGFLGKREDRLIAAAQKGDSEAFESLQTLHSATLRRFIARRVTGPDREDIFQETWLSAWEKLSVFDDRGKFRAWLLTIGFRRIQDYRRREHVRPRIYFSADTQNPAYSESDFQRIELQSALQGFWDACTSDQQEILTMYYSEGLTLAEIANITGRNLNTLKYQFYKVHDEALKMLPSEVETMLSREVMA